MDEVCGDGDISRNVREPKHMRTRMVITGLVVLVIGIAIIAGGAYGLSNGSISKTSFSQQQAGEYVSSELVSNASSVIVVRSPAAVGGMIPAQDLSVVNSANVGSYEVPHNSSAAGSETFIGLRGDFYYVVFSSSQPNTKIVVASSIAETAGSGLLVIAGFLCVIAGIVVAMVGVLRKKPAQSTAYSEDEYYAKRGSGSTAVQ